MTDTESQWSINHVWLYGSGVGFLDQTWKPDDPAEIDTMKPIMIYEVPRKA